MKWVLRALGTAAAACAVLLLLTFTFSIIKRSWFSKDTSRKGHVAVLDISGIILTSASFIKDLQDLQESPGLKAIVIRINSPGGLVAPSQEIFEALKKTDKKTPVFVSMGSLAASGGYYAALGGRKIFASPGTLTASIGVIMEFANTQKLYQWAKVDRYTLKAGKFKDIGSSMRPMTPDEKELFTSMLNDIHQQFRTAVKERRQLSQEELDRCADGRVLTGNQAKTAKLVDALGGFEDALSEAKRAGGLPEDAYVKYPESRGVLRRLLEGDAEGSSGKLFDLVRNVSAGILPEGRQVLLLSPIGY